MVSRTPANRSSGASASRSATYNRQTALSRNTAVPTASGTTPTTPTIPQGSAPTITSGPTKGTPTTTAITISWTVSRSATGQIEYGATSSYGSLSALEDSYVWSTHVQTLTGLTPGATYHYRVHSTTEDGQEVYSADDTFTMGSSSLVFPSTRNPAPFGPASSPWSVPALGGSVTEADFDGARVTRISEATGYSMNYPVLRGWSVDDDYFVLVGNTKRIYEGAYPHTLVRAWSFGVNTNAAWLSGADSDLIYGCHQDGNWLRRYFISTNTSEIRRTFSSYTKVWGGDSSVVSDDDKVLLKAQKANGEWWLISYDIANDTILAEIKFNHPANGQNLQPKNVHTARSGAYGIVTYGAGMGYTSSLYGIYVVNMSTLAVTRTVQTEGAEHFAPGLINTSGHDCLVRFPGYMYDIATGTTTDLFPYAANKNDLNVQHVNAGGQAGWATFSHGLCDRTATGVYGFDQIYSVKLDGSGDVRVWTYAHTVATTARYVADTTDPYASLSRNGDKVAFHSRNVAPSSAGTSGHIYVAEVTA